MKRLLLTILFISVGLSQQLILDITERYSNGNIKSITYHKKTRNIIEAVKYEDYYIHGQKSYEGTYKDGEKDGLFTGWFGNGNKWGEETWKNGKKDGLSTEWRENGTKKEEGTFKDGKLDGLWTVWYDDGQKKKEETYKDGIPNGLFTEWYENGQKKEEGTFKDDKQDGLWIRWNSDGVKIEEKTYVVKAEAAEDAVISQITSGLETFATEQLMANGRRSWPTNPFTALETKPAGYDATSENADADGEWRFNTGTANITHQRADNTVWHWDYDKGTQSGSNAVIGSFGSRQEGVGD
ncbi:MAG: toxin-antitoxin system YwqK family antitoxin [Candidatus Marinimicrobia bacterium]|nr:toxin-antitoxin system YwqK family antitoxin [Candidatus Neomarinimicrobiota bacterium]MBT3936181.1 toxin-antitoxin system YwqK family antitoxin [Candidatus Neomarinimicrobiota bacterium]MBT3962138.1 toxin-antitoxin system YwqK family antitoxin [Candidatus Neomarinimicrobiota bacterium]MBT4383577.1 toxin-antitoxin system YwqK family antitoxin [Candidatus Neomarinimicrobiota bacterium]MBT4634996.1 toxin-antitoxin system YwqK family antitoxin [Candidatus Neomarinimicrobiota bacterium]